MTLLTSEYLRARLRASGINVRSVADEAGCSDKTLYRIRDGKNSPSLDTAENIIRALDKLYPLPAKKARA